MNADGPFDADLPESDRACPPGSIPWALDQDGNLTHITQVKPDHIYRCPACKWALTAVLKTRRRQHFRHRKGHECSNPYDTSLHEAAKQVIKEGNEIALPAVIASHAGRRDDISKPGILRYDNARLEVKMDGIRPDVVLSAAPVAHRPAAARRELLVEIRVNHRTSQRKIDLLRERKLTTIEINLSQAPWFETQDDFKQVVLYEAKREWLVNNARDDSMAALRNKVEKNLGGIGASLNAAYDTEFVPLPNKWRQDIKDARVEDQVGVQIPGDRCFTVVPEIWQSAVLSRFLKSPERSQFDIKAALDWLDREGLLKPAFRRLLGESGRNLLAHIRAVVPQFRHPLTVVEDYAGQMVLYGLLPRSNSAGGSLHPAPTALAEERARRIQEMYYWRLRVTEVEEIFNAIQAEAENGSLMDWEAWLDSFQAALGSTPRARIVGHESEFRQFMAHLNALRQMLEPNAEVPAAGLLDLPLEPERDAREAERRDQDAAERARFVKEIERNCQAAEQARLDREAEQRARAEAERSRPSVKQPSAVPTFRLEIQRNRALMQRVRDRLSDFIRALNLWS